MECEPSHARKARHADNRGQKNRGGDLLGRLGVSAATVYRLCERGELASEAVPEVADEALAEAEREADSVP